MKNMIEFYIHCARCLKEMPPTESPASWQRIQVGVIPDGRLQAWCNRHDIEIGIIGVANPSIEPTCGHSKKKKA